MRSELAIADLPKICHTVLAAAPRTVTDKLQRVYNAAVCVVTGTREFDCGLGQILHNELH